MTGQTPLDRLRDAVETFLDETGVEGTLTGFVLLAQTGLLDPERPADLMPAAFGQHYTTDIDASAAAGLAHGFTRLVDGIIAGSMRANGSDA